MSNPDQIPPTISSSQQEQDNKQLQQQQNNGNAASAGPTTNDNKAASRVSISSIYSPTPIPSTSQSVAYAVAKLKAAALGNATTTQRDISLAIALDVSGSMSGDRLNNAKESIQFVIDQLRPNDSISLVTFSSNAAVALPTTKMNAAGKTLATRRVQGFNASGSTNLSGGLFLAHSLVTGATVPTEPQPDLVLREPLLNMRSSRRAAPTGPSIDPFHPHPTPYPAAPTTIPVEVSHQYNGNGNKPDEKHQYKIKIIAPEDKISKFTIHDPESRFADILGSGETELDLKPLPNSIQQLQISFDVVGSSTEHKVTYFMGEVASGKRTINVPSSPSTTNPNTNNNNNKQNDNTLRVVMLFTDGHMNCGIRDAPTLIAQTQQVLANAPHDSTIFTFGFGANHNADLLQNIATASEGMFYFIENTDAMAEIFADCLGGLFSTVAQNVTVTARLKAGSGVRFGTPMTKFKTKIEDNGNTLVISMKDLYAEEDRDILLELKVDGPTAKSAAVDGAGGVGIEWTLQFTDAVASSSSSTSGANNKVSIVSNCIFNISSDSEPVVNNEVDVQVQRYTSIQVMDQVREAANRGELERARNMAKDYGERLRAAPSASMAANVMIQQQMVNLEGLAQSESLWGARGSKQSVAYAQSHAMQRNNAVSEDCAYAGNAMKMSMRKKAVSRKNGGNDSE